MNDLQTYINTFLVTRQFDNNLDDMGNVNLNSSGSSANQIFIAFDLTNNNYDTTKIENLYDVNITTVNTQNNNEIVAINQEMQTSYNNAIAENQALRDSLADLVNVVEANPSQAESMAQKDLIINLRIQLGQGKTAADFSSDFPYQAL
jgi:hypothetical protein